VNVIEISLATKSKDKLNSLTAYTVFKCF